MRTLRTRITQPIQFHASSSLFQQGCKFNDEIHKLPSGNMTCIPKGVYRFESHEQANRQWEGCLAESMANKKTSLPLKKH